MHETSPALWNSFETVEAKEQETSPALLLVEPDDTLRETLAHVFKAGGYAVTVAEEGQTALQKMRLQSFAIVVAAFELPDMDGLELAQALYDNDPSTECVFLAEPANLLRIIDAAELGNVYDHVWKPMMELGSLVRCVARALERRSMRITQAQLLAELRETNERLQRLESRLEILDRVGAVPAMTDTLALALEDPLIGLTAYTEYLCTRLENMREEPLTAEQMGRVGMFLRETETSVQQCYNTMQSVVAYTQAQDTAPVATDLNATLWQALEMLRYCLDGQEIKLQLYLSPELPPVLANPVRLQQVCINVLLNALEAMGEQGGVLTLMSEAVTDAENNLIAARLRILDTGPGIPTETQARIFDPFFTTHTGKEHTGLGLTIARRILREWNGDLHLESVEGQGTATTLLLTPCQTETLPLPSTALVGSTVSRSESQRVRSAA